MREHRLIQTRFLEMCMIRFTKCLGILNIKFAKIDKQSMKTVKKSTGKVGRNS